MTAYQGRVMPQRDRAMTMSKTGHTGQPSPRELLVFDSSALISYISNLQPMVDPNRQTAYAMQQRYLDVWHNKLGMGTEFEVAIPDHILYEVTGLLPISYKFMKQRCASLIKQIESSEGADRDAAAQQLQSIIDIYVEASPRLFVRPNKQGPDGRMLNTPYERVSPDTRRIMANQLRFLLTFAAYHPEAIRDTKVGEDFCRKLKAEYSTMRPLAAGDVQEAINRRRSKQGNDADWVGSYIPSYGDVQAALGKDFTCDDMRFHISQAYLLGFRSESEYKKVSKPDEASPDDNRRFVAVKEFIGKRGDGKESSPVRNVCPEELRATVGGNYQRLTSGYKIGQVQEVLQSRLTIGYLRKLLQPKAGAEAQLPQLMGDRAKAEPRRVMNLDVALSPTKLLMEQYLFGSVIPGRDFKDSLAGIGKLNAVTTEDALADVLKRLGKKDERETRLHRLSAAGKAIDCMAVALGYDASAWQATTDRIEQNRQRVQGLHQQGFFERVMTVDDLLVVQHALRDQGIATPALDTLLGVEQSVSQKVGGLARHLESRWKQVNKETVRANGKPSEMPPDSGTPIEKMFTEALVSGVITPDEYFDILANAQGLSPDTNCITSEHGSVTISRTVDAGKLGEKSGQQRTHYSIKFADRFNVRGGEKVLAPKLLSEVGQIVRPVAANVSGIQKHFYTMDLDAFIDLARKHRYQLDDGKLSRVLEAPFMRNRYFAALLEDKNPDRRGHAAAILQGAVKVLGDHGKDMPKGEARMIQLQKDFESFHERFYTAEPNSVRPTNSIFASNQRNHRIHRRNLGEISLMEVGTEEARNGAQVWLISNDGDMQYQTTHKSYGEGVELLPRVLQHHSCFRGVAQLPDDPQQAQRVHLVPTDQWLNELVGKSHQRKSGEWTGKKQPFNRQWEEAVSRSDPPRIQQI